MQGGSGAAAGCSRREGDAADGRRLKAALGEREVGWDEGGCLLGSHGGRHLGQSLLASVAHTWWGETQSSHSPDL